jgi:chromosome segregation ATPase
VDIVFHKPPFVEGRVSADKLWNPNELESQCANPACKEGQNEIDGTLDTINDGLEIAARTGNWTEVDQEEVERLDQLGKGALENVDECGIEWPDNDRRDDWQAIENKTDSLETNLSDATEYTRQLYSQSGTGIRGQENISEITGALETLNGLRDKINETEVVPDEDTSIAEGKGDEQQEHDNTIQELREKLRAERDEKQELRDELQEERDEKQEQREKNNELRDKLKEERDEKQELREKLKEEQEKNQELKGENLDVREENLNLKEELQTVGDKNQERGTESERETETADPTEKDRDSEKGAAGVREPAGGGDDPAPSPRDSPRESEEVTQSGENGTNMANASANGGVNESGDNETSPTRSEYPTEATAESEQDSEWKQRWIDQPAPTRGPDFSSTSNGQTSEREATRADDREHTETDGSSPDRDRTDDDNTPGGLG